jgi:hypothetical protein
MLYYWLAGLLVLVRGAGCLVLALALLVIQKKKTTTTTKVHKPRTAGGVPGLAVQSPKNTRATALYRISGIISPI